MPSSSLHFSRQEYDTRVARTRTAMAERGIDCLIVADPSNMGWLTGYDGWSFYVHQAVILTPEGEPLWWGRPMDSAGVASTAWLAESSVYTYPDHYVMNPEKHPYTHLAGVLKDKGWQTARIGVEMDNYYFSAACMETLRSELPDAAFQDTTGLVNWQRLVKSQAELGYIRNAARIVSAMHQRIRDCVEPGMRKTDLVAEIYDASLRGVDGIGGDYPAIVPLLPSGKDAAAAHLTWNENPMKSGECTFFEIAGVYRRYHCPLSRSVFLGKPPQDILDAEKAVMEGLEAGLALAKPGNRCEQIAGAFFAVLKKYGIEKGDRVGYSFGLSYPPDWGERTISLRTGDKTEIRENMVFHFMPGLWQDDWGLEITEAIVIGANGAECLTDVSRELFVKD
ncbi:MAG: ectoine hydrolase DoeA [Fimbriimonadaceae bacterium]|nr:ectoine hydrolase DoeA [Alphaproteobacteria bacterium]